MFNKKILKDNKKIIIIIGSLLIISILVCIYAFYFNINHKPNYDDNHTDNQENENNKNELDKNNSNNETVPLKNNVKDFNIEIGKLTFVNSINNNYKNFANLKEVYPYYEFSDDETQKRDKSKKIYIKNNKLYDVDNKIIDIDGEIPKYLDYVDVNGIFSVENVAILTEKGNIYIYHFADCNSDCKYENKLEKLDLGNIKATNMIVVHEKLTNDSIVYPVVDNKVLLKDNKYPWIDFVQVDNAYGLFVYPNGTISKYAYFPRPYADGTEPNLNDKLLIDGKEIKLELIYQKDKDYFMITNEGISYKIIINKDDKEKLDITSKYDYKKINDKKISSVSYSNNNINLKYQDGSSDNIKGVNILFYN